VVAVSATTRPRRPGEVDGEDYHFMTADQFAAAIASGEFLEHVEYAGNRYGTLRREVEAKLAEGRSVVVEIELEGARAIRAMLPDAVTVFIAPPSMSELARRLEERNTDSAGEIATRLAVSRRELAAMGEFDYRVVNEDVDAAVAELAGIVGREIGSPPVERSAS
jgi:guanylate kinase